MLFACSSRTEEIPPQPWPSAPEPCNRSWCTQGPSIGSILCRTRGREEDLYVLPKVGIFQPPTSQEFPFASHPPAFLLLRIQIPGPVGFLQRPCWSRCSSSPAVTTSHSSFTWCLSTLNKAHLPQMKPMLSPMKPRSTSCTRLGHPHPLSRALSGQGLWCVKDTPCLQLTLAATRGTSLCYAAFSGEGAGCSYPASNEQGSHPTQHTAEASPHPQQPPDVPEEAAWKLQQLLGLSVLLPDLIIRLNDLP